MTAPAIVWFREDLRLADNPALSAAVASKAPLVCLYVLDDETPGRWRLGGAARWWLHHSLAALSAALLKKGGRLVLRRGDGGAVVQNLIEETGAEAVYWNRRYDQAGKAADAALKGALKDNNIQAESFNGALLREPWEVKTGGGGPYRVFTPFWRALKAMDAPAAPLKAPAKVNGYGGDVASETLDDWRLLPTAPDWSGGFTDLWTPGEAAAKKRLRKFLKDGATTYADDRNRPDLDGTSRLSPHLRFGEISPRTIWADAWDAAHKGDIPDAEAEKFLSEIAWREFSYSLLFYNEDFPTAPLQKKFDKFPWAENAAHLRAWQKGQTGYPIVDAGMRQLWVTGWMHNRVRMIVGSFLVKHLLLSWTEGEAWFWDTLVDADLANNAAGWQWIGGCGADAAPYFRIFNPMTQGAKFDPAGDYVRRWVPELTNMPKKYIHAPWEAPADVLNDAGVILSQTYPEPIVNHAEARQRALDAFETLKNTG